MLSDNEPAEVTIYTRNGTKFSQHFTKICPNRWCRKKFNYGYSIKHEKKTYDLITASTKYLVTSNETAFSIEFLYESTLHILHSNSTYQGLSDVYNQFHNFNGENVSRKFLNPKRLASAYFLYSFLEMSERCKLRPKMNVSKNWLDDAILENYTTLKTAFSNVWCAAHKCKIEICEGMMIMYGGIKINR